MAPLRLTPMMVTIDRTAFKLRIWKMRLARYVPAGTYGIALGIIGHETPTGMYFVQYKTHTPDWLAPYSDWVPEEKRLRIAPFWMPDPAAFPGLPEGFIPRGVRNVPLFDEQGCSIPNPANPFEGGFISLSGSEGIGIHGVKFDPLIGTQASHGCIRMETSTFLRNYDRLAIGTPVFIY